MSHARQTLRRVVCSQCCHLIAPAWLENAICSVLSVVVLIYGRARIYTAMGVSLDCRRPSLCVTDRSFFSDWPCLQHAASSVSSETPSARRFNVCCCCCWRMAFNRHKSRHIIALPSVTVSHCHSTALRTLQGTFCYRISINVYNIS